MIRLLALIALVLGVLALRSVMARRNTETPPGPARMPGAPKADSLPETMLACEHCAVYFPTSEAVRAQGKVFCSEQHCRQHGRQPGGPQP
jgi:uncharacterized protein